MKRGQLPQGYTIIEVMIFLTVTGVLLVSALAVFNGQQSRTRFSQGVRETDSQIRAAVTEVESGFYPNLGNFRCRLTAGSPELVNAAAGQGENEDCTFLGKSIQFGLSQSGCSATNHDVCTRYATHTVVGRRLEPNGQQVQSLNDPDGAGVLSGARPTLAVGTVNLAEEKDLPGNLTVYNMYEMRGNAITEIGSVGFFYSLTDYAGTGSDPVSGDQSVDLTTIPGSSLGQTSALEASDVRNLSENNRNPDRVVICLRESPNGNRRAAIVIGGQGRRLSTEVIMDLNATITAPGGRC